jgi:FkbM family methyltransferase
MPEPSRDPFDLIQRYFPDWKPRVILDVGANVGQSAKVFATRFPEAQVHSFEPSPDSFAQLVLDTVRFSNVIAHPCALGRVRATRGLTQGQKSTMNHLVAEGKAMPPGAVTVTVRTGTEVLETEGIAHVDFLKIDTEGHDLEVLQGFQPALGRVDFIEVEAGMNPYNRTHVPFASLAGYLHGEGFHLFRIFQQKMEWKQGGRPVLRRCNPVFISGRLTDLGGIR